MNISLDYDKTYTRDPALWDLFISAAQANGHNVFCLTMRHEHEGCDIPVPVHFTGRQAKAKFASDHGIQVDIWIDDSPHWIFQGAA